MELIIGILLIIILILIILILYHLFIISGVYKRFYEDYDEEQKIKRQIEKEKKDERSF